MAIGAYTAGQWALWGACVAAEVAALTLAILLSARAREHRPVALVLVLGLVVDLAARAAQMLVLEGASRPFTGGARVLYHADTALVTAWPAAVCALAWWVFSGPRKANGPDESEPSGSGLSFRGVGERPLIGTMKRPQPAGSTVAIDPLAVKLIAAGWFAFNVALIAAFPLPKGWTAPALRASLFGAVALTALALMLGWSRRRGRPQIIAALLFVAELAVAIVGPWAGGKPFDDWFVATAVYTAAFSTVAAVQIRWLRSG